MTARGLLRCAALIVTALSSCVSRRDTSSVVEVPPDSGANNVSMDAGLTIVDSSVDSSSVDAVRPQDVPEPDVARRTACVPECGSAHVCQNGTCVALPVSCPCPRGSYCDLLTMTCRVGCLTDPNCDPGLVCESRACRPGCRDESMCAVEEICSESFTCIPGCTTDARCSGGRICEDDLCRDGCRSDSACRAGMVCDTRSKTCRAGCRTDAECGTGSVCDATTRTCRIGCRTLDDCPREQVCEAASRTCAAGCRDDSDCHPGRICDGSPLSCRDGCRTDAACLLGKHCAATTRTCVHGCANDPTRCPFGQACVSLAGGGSECRTTCFQDRQCRSEPGRTRDCIGDYSSTNPSGTNVCLLTCGTNADCSGGDICTLFTSNRSSPTTSGVMRCAPRCAETTCASSVGAGFGCVCRSDGTCGTEGSPHSCYRFDYRASQPPSCAVSQQPCGANPMCCDGYTCVANRCVEGR